MRGLTGVCQIFSVLDCHWQGSALCWFFKAINSWRFLIRYLTWLLSDPFPSLLSNEAGLWWNPSCSDLRSGCIFKAFRWCQCLDRWCRIWCRFSLGLGEMLPRPCWFSRCASEALWVYVLPCWAAQDAGISGRLPLCQTEPWLCLRVYSFGALFASRFLPRTSSTIFASSHSYSNRYKLYEWGGGKKKKRENQRV